MKILFLCKRRYMHRDVISDRYGRYFEIPEQLAALGCELTCVCLSYYRNDEVVVDERAGIRWIGVNWYSWLFLRYLGTVYKMLRTEKPDVIVAGSDMPHIVFGKLVSGLFNIRFAADLYDNYESYGMARIPLLKRMFYRSLRGADYIFTVSDALNRYIASLVVDANIHTIENAIDPGIFHDVPQHEARSSLGLELGEGAIAIGMSGSLDGSRGADVLYRGFELFREKHPHATLILAGTMGVDCPIPSESTVYLGRLAHERMNFFYNAMDTNVIGMSPGSFGNYAFPQKAYEILATSTPLVAPDFGPMRDLLSESPQCLFTPNDAASICDAIERSIEEPCSPELEIPSWTNQAGRILSILSR